jgi:hypothetical protein
MPTRHFERASHDSFLSSASSLIEPRRPGLPAAAAPPGGVLPQTAGAFGDPGVSPVIEEQEGANDEIRRQRDENGEHRRTHEKRKESGVERIPRE